MNSTHPENSIAVSRLRRTIGVAVDVFLIVGAIIAVGTLLGAPGNAPGNGLLHLAIGMSLGGLLVAGNRPLTSPKPVPLGIRLWGWHGLLSAAAILAWAIIDVDIVDRRVAFSAVTTLSLATMIGQAIVTLIAIVQVSRGRATTTGDFVGTAVCLAYAVLVTCWLLFVWK